MSIESLSAEFIQMFASFSKIPIFGVGGKRGKIQGEIQGRAYRSNPRCTQQNSTNLKNIFD